MLRQQNKRNIMAGLPIEGSVALVSGSNRGIGRAIVEALLERGVAKVYAGARNTAGVADLVAAHPGRVVALEIDVTNEEQIAKAASEAKDVNLLVNNAGVAVETGQQILDPAYLEAARWEFEVNVFGVVRLTQAFSPILQANGGGAILNLASIASFVNFPIFQSYSVSKAAVHSVTQAIRIAHPNTLVVGIYPGPVDTDMAAKVPFDKATPASVAHEILDGVEAGHEEILPDPMAKDFGGFFFKDPKGLERQTAEMAAAA